MSSKLDYGEPGSRAVIGFPMDLRLVIRKITDGEIIVK
jgi:hypothetical protein